MDVNIVYFHIQGSSPIEPAVWSAILIEDGDMESLVGTGQNTLHCILSGLQTCLERLPSTTPIIIRSNDRDVHQMGTSWMANWKRDGWDHESESELISTIMNLISVRKIQWFKPPFTDPIDKQVHALALAEWHQLQEADASETLDNEVEESSDQSENIDVTDIMGSNHDPSTPILEISTSGSLPELEDTSGKVLPPEPTKPHCESNTLPEDAHSQTHDLQEDQDQPPSNMEDDSTSILIHQTPPETVEEIDDHQLDKSVDTSDEEHHSTLQDISLDLDQERYPYIDDAGFEQINMLFTPHTESDVTLSQSTRILGYVEGFGYAHMGSWAFILIDRPSQFALIKSQANRNSTQRRARLQGCIEILMSIRDRRHSVELRTQDPELFDLLTALIADPMTTDIPEIWEEENAFVSQLSYWIEQSVVSTKLLSVLQSQRDQAIQETSHLARENLNHLNQGLRAQTERRRKFYPLERLVE